MLVNMFVVYLRAYKIAKSIYVRNTIKKHTCVALKCNSFYIKKTCTILTLLNYAFRFYFLIRCLLHCITYKVLRNNEEAHTLYVKACAFHIIKLTLSQSSLQDLRKQCKILFVKSTHL